MLETVKLSRLHLNLGIPLEDWIPFKFPLVESII